MLNQTKLVFRKAAKQKSKAIAIVVRYAVEKIAQNLSIAMATNLEIDNQLI